MTFSISITTPSGEMLTRDYPDSIFDNLPVVRDYLHSLHDDAITAEQEDDIVIGEEKFNAQVDEGMASKKDE